MMDSNNINPKSFLSLRLNSNSVQKHLSATKSDFDTPRTALYAVILSVFMLAFLLGTLFSRDPNPSNVVYATGG